LQETHAKPISAASLSGIEIPPFKSVSQVVITKELARHSTPSAESVLRRLLTDSVARHADVQFLDPNVTAIANVRPGSITSLGTPFVSTGSSASQIQADLIAMTALLTSWIKPVWVMKPQTASVVAARLGNVVSTNEQLFILDIPVVKSVNSPSQIVLLDAATVLYADEGSAEIRTSEHASIVMDSAPQTSPMTTELVSLFQRNLMSIMVERDLSWQLAGPATNAIWMSTAY
jgi:hypothetical protein